MTFYHPFPFLGMVVWEHGAAEICVHVTGNGWKRYGCWWLLMIVEQWFRNLYTIGASSLQHFYTTSAVPTSLRQRSRPHTSRWQLLLWRRLTVARHSRTRAPDASRSTFRHGDMSPLFVNCRGLNTASLPRFAVSVALEPRRAPSTSWPRTSHRRPPSFSAVHHATSVRQPERHLHRTIRT